MTMRPEDDPGWASYGETILRFPGPDALEIDLSRPVGPAARAQLAALHLAQPFGLVTPENPFGRRSSPEENDQRLARFLDELVRRGAACQRVDGVSPDGEHVERGVALVWPQGDVVALARQWDQSAVYWWDGTRFWVVGALTQTAPVPLGGVA